MDASIIEMLRVEEVALSRKLDACRAMLTAYGSDTRVRDGERAKPIIATSGVTLRQSEYVARILMAAKAVIEEQGGGPVATRVILDGVNSRGIEVRGKEPQNALSAVLSRAEGFANHNREGWILVLPTDEEAEIAENGALNGHAASAPETGEGATSPIENRTTLDELLG